MKPDESLVVPLREQGYVPAGRLRTRTSAEIRSSPWSIGLETIDRDYVDFGQIAPHLGELGAKQARIQAGWARCEPHADGVFCWQWLDDIVDTCVRAGIRPWLETSYGNPGYPGGGGIGLAEGLPASPEALAAWDRWVGALAERYASRAGGWEIWNEPDIYAGGTPEGYTELFIRTAQQIRTVDPQANIIGLALAGKMDYAEGFLRGLADAGCIDLLDEITFHFYPHNPDDGFDKVRQLAELAGRYAPHVTLRQGETGSPSETRPFMALGKFEWSEHKQAAWDLRRLLAHHAAGIPMNLFQLADMYYSKDKGKYEGRNSKGLLHIRPDKTVAYRKPSYFAAQHVFSVFDERFELRRLDNEGTRLGPDNAGISVYTWTAGATMLTGWWRSAEPPALEPGAMTAAAIPWPKLEQPVLLDFLSGIVFTVPSSGRQGLPCADSPLALTDRSVLELRPLG